MFTNFFFSYETINKYFFREKLGFEDKVLLNRFPNNKIPGGKHKPVFLLENFATSGDLPIKAV